MHPELKAELDEEVSKASPYSLPLELAQFGLDNYVGQVECDLGERVSNGLVVTRDTCRTWQKLQSAKRIKGLLDELAAQEAR